MFLEYFQYYFLGHTCKQDVQELSMLLLLAFPAHLLLE